MIDELTISNTVGSGGLLFFDREPSDRSFPIDRFSVRVTCNDLSAAVRVYAGYAPSHPARLFVDMGRQWAGWQGELVWESLEQELSLHCTRDRLGHIAIRLKLRSGPMSTDWRAEATIMTEAGQLEGIAEKAKLFFGKES